MYARCSRSWRFSSPPRSLSCQLPQLCEDDWPKEIAGNVKKMMEAFDPYIPQAQPDVYKKSLHHQAVLDANERLRREAEDAKLQGAVFVDPVPIIASVTKVPVPQAGTKQ